MDCNIKCCALLILVAVSATATTNNSCVIGFTSDGFTEPRGDIVLRYGRPLEVSCILHSTENINSSDITFTLSQPDHQEVDLKSYVTIVNETTISVRLDDIGPAADILLNCVKKTSKGVALSKPQGVCLNRVAIGYPPQPVTNFSCISHNWENLNCSWVAPNNYITTTYKLSYRVAGPDEFLCPKLQYPIHENSDSHRCIWEVNSKPMFRRFHPTYYFYLEANNSLGTNDYYFNISLYARILPDKPEGLHTIQTTPESIYIRWQSPFNLAEYPQELKHRVKYRTKYDDPDHWKEADNRTLKSYKSNQTKQHDLNITGLLYPHTMYDIRVEISTMGELWSEPATITPYTRPTVPFSPPKTTKGSFEVKDLRTDTQIVLHQRDISIYWQEIPEYWENGDGFKYEVVAIDLSNNSTIFHETKKHFTVFTNLRESKYLFSVVSRNSEGDSKERSQVIVPRQGDLPPPPEKVTKRIMKNSTYNLSWNQPVNKTGIVSYTIFWCENKSDLTPCSGRMNWTTVGRDVSEKDITLEVDSPYKFAVSANTAELSSGLVWATCELPEGSDYWGKVREFSADPNSIQATSAALKWKFDCTDRIGFVKSFQIVYCPTSSITCESSQCQSMKSCNNSNETRELQVENPASFSTNITGLKPYTSYMFFIYVKLSKDMYRLNGGPTYLTTLEAAPSVIQNVNVSRVSDSEFTIVWGEPHKLNGVIRRYQVYLNGQLVDKTDKNVTSFTFRGLESYTSYDYSVEACTNYCSDRSESKSVTTSVGKPGEVVSVVSWVNRTMLEVKWQEPKTPGGRLDFYYVQIEVRSGGKVRTGLEKVKDKSVRMAVPECGDKESGDTTMKVYVQGVNQAENGTLLEGAKRESSLTGKCLVMYSGMSLGLIIMMSVIIIMLVVLVCVLCGFLCRWAWVRCKLMQDVHVKLPARLETRAEDKSDAHSMRVWVQQEEPPRYTASPDQQRLLRNKDEHHEFFTDELGERDSSGCGSGQESVSSEPSSAVSADSGTEPDNVAPAPKDEGPAYVSLPAGGLLPCTQGYVTLPFVQPSRGYMLAAAPTSPTSPLPPYCVLPKAFPQFSEDDLPPLNTN